MVPGMLQVLLKCRHLARFQPRAWGLEFRAEAECGPDRVRKNQIKSLGSSARQGGVYMFSEVVGMGVEEELEEF